MWFILAALSALGEATKDLLNKQASVRIDEYSVLFLQRLFSLVILLPLMLLHLPVQLSYKMVGPYVVVIVLDTIASVFYIKALKYSPLSLVAPIAVLTPVVTLGTAFWINAELPSLLGIIGVAVSVIGIYILQFHHSSKHWLAPFSSLLQTKGTRLMLGVVLLWSITSAFDKTVVEMTNGFFYAGLVSIGYTLVLLPIAVYRQKKLSSVFAHSKQLAPIGLISGLALLCQMLALPLTFVSYVIAVKLSSSAISIWFGKFFLKEAYTMERLIGTAIILSGVGLMLFAS